MMEGDVAEKDNVLLTLCCSKNSYNREDGEGEGGWVGWGGGYLHDHLRSAFFMAQCGLFGLRHRLDLRLEGWRDEIWDEHEGQSS